MASVLLVVYDNEDFTNWFPLNMGYLAAVARNAGHEVSIWNQDIHHYPDEYLKDELDTNHYDVVGVGVVAGYWPYKKLMALSKVINDSERRSNFSYVIGGHGPTPEPEYFLRKTGADVCCMGEAEVSFVQLMNGEPLNNIDGIAYQYGDRVEVNKRAAPVQDLDMVPYPAWDLFPMNVYRMGRDPNIRTTDFLMSVISGRGCSGRCSFCYRMEDGLRLRSIGNVMGEVAKLHLDHGITYFRFCDELTMCSEDRIAELSEAFLQFGKGVRWNCNGRLNYATPEVLKLMKRSGCVFINYGIEALDDDVLKQMHKGLTVEIITKGIEATLEAGISPGFNIIWGNKGDTVETLMKAVDFLLEYDDQGQMRTIRPVTPYPGSPLYYEAIERGLLKDVADFYENKHLNSELVAVNFTDLSDDDFHHQLLAWNEVLISHYYECLRKKTVATARDLYRNRNTAFRGFRQK